MCHFSGQIFHIAWALWGSVKSRAPLYARLGGEAWAPLSPHNFVFVKHLEWGFRGFTFVKNVVVCLGFHYIAACNTNTYLGTQSDRTYFKENFWITIAPGDIDLIRAWNWVIQPRDSCSRERRRPYQMCWVTGKTQRFHISCNNHKWKRKQVL